MTSYIEKLLANNQVFVSEKLKQDPDFFISSK